MPSVAEKSRQQFVEHFNRVLGSKTGRPMTYQSDNYRDNLVPEEFKVQAAVALAKKLKTTKAKKIKTKKEEPGSTTADQILTMLGRSGTPVRGNNKLDLSKLSGGLGDEGGIKGLWKDIDEALTNNPVTDFVQDNPVTKAAAKGVLMPLEALGRVGYTVTGALDSASEAGNFSAFPALFKGAWAGASGKKKVGFGDIIDNPPVMAQYVDEMEKQAPERVTPQMRAMRDKLMADYNDKTGFEQWSRRIAGGAGDILLDPLTYFTGGLTTVEKNLAKQGGRALAKEGAKGTLNVGADALKSQATRITKAAVDEFNLADTRKVRKGSTVTRSLTDHIGEAVRNKIDSMVYDMRKGGMIGGNPNDYGTIAHTISEGARDSFVDAIQRPSERYLSNIKVGKRYSDAERRALRARNPLFGEWMDIAEKIAQGPKRLDADQIFAAAHKEFRRTIEPRIQEIRGMVRTQLDDAVMRVPTAQWMGKKMYFPKLGSATGKVAGKIADSPHVANQLRAWRYSSWFPGYTSHITAKLKSHNVKAFDEFKAEIEDLLKDTTAAQRINIHRAIQEGTDLPGVDGTIQQKVKEHYHKMWQSEIDEGARSISVTPEADNYVYNVMKGGRRQHPDFDTDWRALKKKQVHDYKNIDGFTSQDAIAKGWKPVEDVGDALVARKAKNIRELTRVNFKKDLIGHYGIKSSIDPRHALAAGMKRVDEHKFPALYQKFKVAPGEHLYLDKDIEKVFDNYNELVKYGKNAKADSALMGIDAALKVWKSANTIYWPGFHLRNMVSDFFMGLLDGVAPHRYGQIMKAMTNKDTAYLKVGGERVPFRTVQKSYLDNAATAGFFNTEMAHAFSPEDLSTIKYMNSTVKGTAGKVHNQFRDLSQHREDFGRFVHYYHALDEEMAHQVKKGLKGEIAWKNAEEAALERVNKFKFDYNALTPREQAMRRFGMPFYTYMRKATPVLLENMLMNPKQFARIQRMQDQLAPSDDFKAGSLPGWASELAYSELSSGNHIGFTDALFPSRTLQDTFSYKTLPSKINPLAQGLFELASGKDTFSGKPVGEGLTGVTDILKNKFRVISTWRSIESDTKPTLDKWAGLFGIPLIKISEGRQGQRLKELEDEVTKKSTRLNTKLDELGLKVRVSGDKIYLIQPKSPTADEIKYHRKPKYPPNPKEVVRGTYDSFESLPFKF